MKKLSIVLCIILIVTTKGLAQWTSHNVIQIDGQTTEIKLPAKLQLLTENWNRVVAVPYLVYMPEKDRVLMLVSCDYPHQAMMMKSDDHGASWSQPRYVHTDSVGNPDTGLGTGLTYLGNGKLLMVSGTEKDAWVWFSSDYGETWNDRAVFPPASSGLIFNFGWDPPLIDKDPLTGKVQRVIAGGYILNSTLYEGAAKPGYSNGGIRLSMDGARTWGEVINVPQWLGADEVAFSRARNGDIVAACRTNWPYRFHKSNFDHYEGLGVSISKDNGKSWSKITELYAWGHHHPCMVVLPNNDIVMTYVVRKGYPETDDGYPQFGIEAIVSHDNGQTWDLDHRYILSCWKGIRKGPNAWFSSSQATSTVLLPDGSLLTAFGTGYRAVDSTGKGRPTPRDVGLINWNMNYGPVSSDRTITNAPFDSDLRNEFNPDPSRKMIRVYCPAQPEKENLAVTSAGAKASATENDGDPTFVFHNPYNQPILTLGSMPASVEISWPNQQLIDEIHIQPGAPEWFNRASTECTPLDYQLQYKKENKWIDIVPAVRNAKRYNEFYSDPKAYIIQDEEFEYIHKFAPISVKAIRLYITRSSDTGKDQGAGGKVEVPEDRRKTSIRAIEVFAAKKPPIKVESIDYTEKVIYHSPETPGYTSWVGLALLPGGTLRCDFSQLTGPKDKPLVNVPVLESQDGGENWSKVSGDAIVDPATEGIILNFTPQGIILSRMRTSVTRNGTLIRLGWMPWTTLASADPNPNSSGYLERSTDGGKTWGEKIFLLPAKEYHTWPSNIRQLHDGRLVLMAGVWKKGDGDIPTRRMTKMMFISSDEGKTWSKPVILIPTEVGVCEESDFCELPNGDLFWIHRVEHYPDKPTEIPKLAARMGSKPPESYWYSDRMQSITRKNGNTFIPEPSTPAPFPHSGYPVVLYTSEGLILHLATDGIYWTADVGKTWTKFNLPGTNYYPKALQLADGKIICIGHRGSDDYYGSVDQAIVEQTFRLYIETGIEKK